MASLSAKLVDFHCHLDLYPDFEGLVSECELHGVYTLAVTTTPLAFERNLALTQNTRHVRAALGLHPQLVGDRPDDFERFAQRIRLTRYIGEVGLDASPRFLPSFDAQQRVFGEILQLCAQEGGKIISVHSVRCAAKVLDHIERCLPLNRGRVVLHWFTGSRAEATRAVRLGCYFSINPRMLERLDQRSLIAAIIPIERLLTETDGPFVRHGKRPIRPLDTDFTVGELARTLGRECDEVQHQICVNLNHLLNGP